MYKFFSVDGLTTVAFTASSSWATDIIEQLIHPATVIGVPSIIFGLLLFAIFNSSNDFSQCVRSICAAILPFLLMTYLYKFQSFVLENLAKVDSWLSFLVSLIWGFALMFLIRILHENAEKLPVLELILSFTLSLLLFSYASTPNSEILSYYYGIVSGFVCYVAFLGLPIKSLRKP